MNQWFEHLVEHVAIATDEDSATEALEYLTEQAGFDWYSYVSVEGSLSRRITNLPADWRELYYRREFARVDPILRRSRTEMEAFFWTNPLTGKTEGRLREYSDQAAAFGIRSGISVPVRSGYSQRAIFTLSSKDPEFALTCSFNPAIAASAVAQLHAKLSFLEINPISDRPVRLTTQQNRCLRWNVEGKSARTIGSLLGISPHTVKKHLLDARGQLGASSIVQAARIATILKIV